MLSTPKRDIQKETGKAMWLSYSKKPRRAYSLSSKSTIGMGAQHASVMKSSRVSYTTILNKLLGISQPLRFMSLASRYIDRCILECKEAASSQALDGTMAQLLLSDGLFIKKLAECSEPLKVCKHFLPGVKQNRKALKTYFDSLEPPKSPKS